MENMRRVPKQPAAQAGPELPQYMRPGRQSAATFRNAETIARQPASGAAYAGNASQRKATPPSAARGGAVAHSGASGRSTIGGNASRSAAAPAPHSGTVSRGGSASHGGTASRGGTSSGAYSRQAPARRGGGNGAAGGSGAAGGGKKRKKKLGYPQKLMRIALGLFGGLIVVIASILLLQNKVITTPSAKEDSTLNMEALEGKKFMEGVIIENVDVGEKTAEEARPLIQRAIEEQLNGISIVLKGGEQSWTVTAVDLGLTSDVDALLLEALSFGRNGTMGENAEAKQLAAKQGKTYSLDYSPNRNMLLNRLNQIAGEANKAPVEPHLIPHLEEKDGVYSQSFEDVPGENGRMLNVEATADTIVNMITQKQFKGEVTPVFDEVPPTYTLEFLRENTQRIATFSTNYAKSSSNEIIKNRCFNIEKAATRINEFVIQPEEEFSFNGWVGPRTKETGWAQANGINKGKEYTLQYGGGICQASTTLYGAVRRANLPITERNNHSIPSDYVEFGQDATVDTRGLDLKFVNDTGAPIYIFVYIKPYKDSSRRLEITVSLYGKPLPEGVRYEMVSQVVEEMPNEEVERVNDSSIPKGYEMEKYQHRKGYVVEVYLEKYEGKEVVDSKKLYTDKYYGNKQQILVGTGDPAKVAVPEGAVPVGTIGQTEDTTSGDTANVPELPVVAAETPSAA